MKNSIVAALAVAASLLLSGVANATGEEEPRPPKAPPQGCTPGYWKNHTEAWITYEPYYGIDTVFVIPAPLYSEFVHVSMIDALNLNGGSGVDGAARILLRHAMAALLNMRHPDVNYPLGKDQIKNTVNEALASLNRAKILALKDALEANNELGCPL